MHDLIDANAIENLYLLFVTASFLILFWIIEVFWYNRDHKAWLIFLFPPVIIYFILKYWDQTKARCFFAVLLFVIILIIGALTDYNFSERIFVLFTKICIWPYYAYDLIKNPF